MDRRKDDMRESRNVVKFFVPYDGNTSGHDLRPIRLCEAPTGLSVQPAGAD